MSGSSRRRSGALATPVGEPSPASPRRVERSFPRPVTRISYDWRMSDGAPRQGTGVQVLIERLPSALVIAGASAASYWLAHVYESAYLGYFRFPASLVRVSTNTTILAAGAVLSVVWGAFTLAAIVADLLRRWQLDTEVLVYVMVTLFRGFAGLYISARDWHAWALHLGIVAALLVVLFFVKRWEKRQAQRQSEQPAATQQQTQVPSQIPPPSAAPVPTSIAVPAVARLLLPWIGREGLVFVFVLFLAQGVARDAGRAAARDASEFFTLERPGEYVVLRAYDDVLVAAPLDRARHRVGSKVLLVPVAKQGEVGLRWEALGHLHRELEDASPPEGAASVAAGSAGTQGAPALTTGMASALSRENGRACLSCHPG